MSRARAVTAGFAALLAASLIALGGCAVTKTSNIEQYQTEAEALATSIVELVRIAFGRHQKPAASLAERPA